MKIKLWKNITKNETKIFHHLLLQLLITMISRASQKGKNDIYIYHLCDHWKRQEIVIKISLIMEIKSSLALNT